MDAKSVYESKPWVEFYDPDKTATIEVPFKSIAQWFDEATDEYRNKAALVFYGKKISYRTLREHCDRMAAALSGIGLKRGDRVALFLVNCPQFVICYFAALKIGCVLTPISPVYTSYEVKYQLENSEAKALVCQDILYETFQRAGVAMHSVVLTNVSEYLPVFRKFFGEGGLAARVPKRGTPGVYRYQDLLRHSPPAPPAVALDPRKDAATLPYTGGTTGRPKGVLLTHGNVAAAVASNSTIHRYEPGGEVVMAFLPFYHIFGQVSIMVTSLLFGQTLVLFTTPDTEAILDACERYQATVFLGVPTLFDYLKDHKDTTKVNWQRFTVILCGADTLHENTVKEWERRTRSRIIEGYGLTETCATSHLNPITRPKPGSFGVPVPNVTAAVVDPEGSAFLRVGEVGELVLKGPMVMQGYWKNPEQTRSAFLEVDGERWLRTGDLVRMDEEGYFYYYDRRKDLIKHRGYSVFARDVEDVLYTHPLVKAAGVIGVPDPAEGSIIKAVVVLQPDARGRVTEDDLRKYCQERLAHYKVPKLVEFRGELPKTDTGKVSHRELREELGREAQV